jgi:hypothetical protein
VVRVTVVDAAGNEAKDESARFEIRSGTPTLTLRYPDSRVVVGLGSTQSVYWSSPLGLGAAYQVQISRDGGVSWDLLAPVVFGRTNDFRWAVTAPSTTQGLVRVRAINVSLEDVSRNVFTIADPDVVVTAPSTSTVWISNTQAKVNWRSNLGVYDRLNVRLSTDGGSSFPILLAASLSGTPRVVTVNVPPVPTSTARILVESLDRPEWRATSTVFTIAPP